MSFISGYRIWMSVYRLTVNNKKWKYEYIYILTQSNIVFEGQQIMQRLVFV